MEFGGGKNLGVFCCETSRMITADIDMLFPEETLISCMSGQGYQIGQFMYLMSILRIMAPGVNMVSIRIASL